MSTIKTITRNKNRPILFEFQNGKIKPNNDYQLEVALFKDRATKNKVLGVSNGNMIYSGKVNNDDLFNSFLAISKKSGKEIELVEIDTTSLTPFFKKTIATTSPIKGHSISELQKKFGSKKAKRYTEQYERQVRNMGNVTEQLEKIVDGMDVDIETNIIPETPSDSGYRPKINRDASTQEGVYLLSDIVSDDILNSLEEKLDTILSINIKKCGLTTVIENHIQSLQEQSLVEQIFKDKCKLLLCVNNLIEFMKTPIKNMTKKYTACNYSILMDKYIKNNFIVNGTRPLNMKDKCLCYIIVLLMIAVDYEMDLDALSKDLNIGLKKLKQLARLLGFSPSSKLKNGITLKIPVPPPPSLFIKKKRTRM